MNPLLIPILYIVSVLIALGRMMIAPRLAIPTLEGAYEAFAHLFVGFLILVPLYDWKQTLGPSRTFGLIGLALSLWELGWFLFQKFIG